jgi:hypothetical protein
MDRGLGLDVVDHDAAVILMLDLRGDLAVDDTLEKGLGHIVSGAQLVPDWGDQKSWHTPKFWPAVTSIR